MYNEALVVGKFYPPHRGHKYLIDTAQSKSKHVTIMVCETPEQTIPGSLRAEWLREIHPHATVIVINDTLSDDDSRSWAEHTIQWLGFVPDAVFTSESYGDQYAYYMGTKHEVVDKLRTHIPISATKIRANPYDNWQFLEPCVRAYYTKRIAVVGAESTGTTTLSQDLAKHYKTSWVPEYGRMYSEGKIFAKTGADWETREFLYIANQQNRLEDELAKSSEKILICDTNAFATSIWHERYMGKIDKLLEKIVSAPRNQYSLYIITGDEIPFVQDGTRDGEHIRHWMHQRFIKKLEQHKLPYIVVTGNKEERLNQAVQAINNITK